jgi:alanine racemase
VDLGALVHNATVLRRTAPDTARLGLLVKANGYGHGMEMAARAALAGGADQLIVATLDEALALRGAGLEAPLLVVYPILSAGVADAAAAGIELTVGGRDSATRTLRAWGAARDRMPDRTLAVHVEVDTGMGRGGVAPDDLASVVRGIEAQPATRIAGIWSHLADGADETRSAEQVRRFDAAVATLPTDGRAGPPLHLVATEGLFTRSAPALDMVRIGLAFYGELGLDVAPAAELASLAAGLRPAMAVKARAIRVEPVPAGGSVGYGGEWVADRPSTIATLPIGYADGWPRASWPGASALVRGRRVPLVGRVSMDTVCADVTEIGELTERDEFVLLGAQGAERISVAEIARHRGTSPNEVLCSFGPRLPRVHRGMELVETPR